MTGAKTCPICQKPQNDEYRPFCSKRCADIDLSRWLKDSYSIPAEERVPDVIANDKGDE